MKTGSVILVIAMLIRFCPTGFAGGEERVAGGRAAGLGGSAVVATDGWSGANNPAGMGWIQGWDAGIFAGNHFLLKELGYETVSLTWSGRPGGFGLVLGYYGFEAYHELFTGISYARRFGKRFAAGVQLNYQRIAISEGYGAKGILSAKVGLIVKPDDHWSLGLVVSNPVPVQISSNPKEYLPLLFRLGVGYAIRDRVWLTVEGEKDLIHPLIIRTGIEVVIVSVLTGRFGMSTGPFVFTAGTGLKIRQWRIDIATGYHLVLGFSPALSLSWHPGIFTSGNKRKRR